MITDCHIHPATEPDTNFGRFLPTGDFRQQVETLRRAGMERACGCVISHRPAAVFGDIRRMNDAALSLRDLEPDFYVPGIHIHPGFPGESCAELQRVRAEGVLWIGELVGYMTGYGETYASPEALTIMRMAAELGMVVNFHCGDLEVIERLAQAVPGLPLVLAHPGDGDNFLKRIALVARYPNLHLDISGTGIDRYGMLRHAIDTAGSNKLLLGSDYPINNPAVYLSGALFEPLTAEEKAAVLSGNFDRLVAGQDHVNSAVDR
jgi:predicted TIM-barrel fold metal-dependent hydrolase